MGLEGVRCLVLGASGFLGAAVVRALLRAGARVHGYSRRAPERERAIPWTLAALDDERALRRALAGQQVVFHLVGSSLPGTVTDLAGDVRTHVTPTLRLLQLCADGNIRRLVFASSGGTVYGPAAQTPTPESAAPMPTTAYGLQKLVIEQYLDLCRRACGLDGIALRLANPYGPGQSPFRRQGVVAAMLHRALSGEPVEIWGTGEVTRDFIYVDDVASAFLAAALYDGPHRVLNVGSGVGRSLNELLADVSSALGLPSVDVVRRAGRAADVPVNVLDTALIRRETGWRPRVGLAQGLAETAGWLRATTRPGALVG